MGHENRSSIKQVVKDLIHEDGWKGFYRGFGPRFFSMSAWGTSMILAYEYLSKNSSSLITVSLCVSPCIYVYYMLVFYGFLQANIEINVQFKLRYKVIHCRSQYHTKSSFILPGAVTYVDKVFFFLSKRGMQRHHYSQ